MFHMTLIMEDTLVIATREISDPVNNGKVPLSDSEEQPEFRVTEHFEDRHNLPPWDVTLTDNLTGVTAKCRWTDDQFAAITALALGVGEEKSPGYDIEKLYEVANAALENVPTQCYPIP